MTHTPPIFPLHRNSIGDTPTYDVPDHTTTPDRVSRRTAKVGRRGGWWAAIVTGAVLAAGIVSTTPALAIGPCDTPMPPPWCGDDPPTPPKPTTRIDVLATGSAEFDWGNDHQQVTATLNEVVVLATGQKNSAYVSVVTHTWTDNVFAGFHASSWADFGPSFYSTGQQRYGVDGSFFGTSDRTDVHTESVPVAFAENDRGGTVTPHATHN